MSIFILVAGIFVIFSTLPSAVFGESLYNAATTMVAYNTSLEGREYLEEGYVDQEQWQNEFDAKAAELESIYSELLELRDYLSEDNQAIVDNCNLDSFKYISELEEASGQFAAMRDEALAAKERQLERQRQQRAAQQQQQQVTQQQSYSGSSSRLTRSSGVNHYNGNKETYYNLDMSGVISNAQTMGIQGNYWIRDDGVKMYGDYVIVAAQMDKGTIISTSLGTGIVLDYCPAGTIDIATSW